MAFDTPFRLEINYKNKKISFGPRRPNEVGRDILAVKTALGLVKLKDEQEESTSGPAPIGTAPPMDKQSWFDCKSGLGISLTQASTYDSKTKNALMNFQIQNQFLIISYLIEKFAVKDILSQVASDVSFDSAEGNIPEKYSKSLIQQIETSIILFDSELGLLGEATLAVLHGWVPHTRVLNDSYAHIDFPMRDTIYDIVHTALARDLRNSNFGQTYSDMVSQGICVEGGFGPPGHPLNQQKLETYLQYVSAERNWTKLRPVPNLFGDEQESFQFGVLEFIKKDPETSQSILYSATTQVIDNLLQDLTDEEEMKYAASSEERIENLKRMYFPDPFTDPAPFEIDDERIGYFLETEYELSPEKLPSTEGTVLRGLEQEALENVFKHYRKPDTWFLNRQAQPSDPDQNNEIDKVQVAFFGGSQAPAPTHAGYYPFPQNMRKKSNGFNHDEQFVKYYTYSDLQHRLKFNRDQYKNRLQRWELFDQIASTFTATGIHPSNIRPNMYYNVTGEVNQVSWRTDQDAEEELYKSAIKEIEDKLRVWPESNEQRELFWVISLTENDLVQQNYCQHWRDLDEIGYTEPLIKFVEYRTPSLRPNQKYRALFFINKQKLDLITESVFKSISSNNTPRRASQQIPEDQCGNTSSDENKRRYQEYKAHAIRTRNEIVKKFREEVKKAKYQDEYDNMSIDLGDQGPFSLNDAFNPFGGGVVSGKGYTEKVFAKLVGEDSSLLSALGVYNTDAEQLDSLISTTDPLKVEDNNMPSGASPTEEEIDQSGKIKISLGDLKARLKIMTKDIKEAGKELKKGGIKFAPGSLFNADREASYLNQFLIELEASLKEFKYKTSDQMEFTFEFEKANNKAKVGPKVGKKIIYLGFALPVQDDPSETESSNQSSPTVSVENHVYNSERLKHFESPGSPFKNLTRPRTVNYISRIFDMTTRYLPEGSFMKSFMEDARGSCKDLGIDIKKTLGISYIGKYTSGLQITDEKEKTNYEAIKQWSKDQFLDPYNDWVNTSASNMRASDPSNPNNDFFNEEEALKMMGEMCEWEDVYKALFDKLDLASLLCDYIKCIKLPGFNIKLPSFKLPPLPKIPIIGWMGEVYKFLIENFKQIINRLLCTAAKLLIDKLTIPFCEEQLRDFVAAGSSAGPLWNEAMADALLLTGITSGEADQAKDFFEDSVAILTGDELCRLLRGERLDSATTRALIKLVQNRGLEAQIETSEDLTNFFGVLGSYLPDDLCESLENLPSLQVRDCEDSIDVLSNIRNQLLSDDPNMSEEDLNLALDIAKKNRDDIADQLKSFSSSDLGSMAPSFLEMGNPSSMISDYPPYLKTQMNDAVTQIFEPARSSYISSLSSFIPAMRINMPNSPKPGDKDYDETTILELESALYQMSSFSYYSNLATEVKWATAGGREYLESQLQSAAEELERKQQAQALFAQAGRELKAAANHVKNNMMAIHRRIGFVVPNANWQSAEPDTPEYALYERYQELGAYGGSRAYSVYKTEGERISGLQPGGNHGNHHYWKYTQFLPTHKESGFVMNYGRFGANHPQNRQWMDHDQSSKWLAEFSHQASVQPNGHEVNGNHYFSIHHRRDQGPPFPWTLENSYQDQTRGDPDPHPKGEVQSKLGTCMYMALAGPIAVATYHGEHHGVIQSSRVDSGLPYWLKTYKSTAPKKDGEAIVQPFPFFANSDLWWSGKDGDNPSYIPVFQKDLPNAELARKLQPYFYDLVPGWNRSELPDNIRISPPEAAHRYLEEYYIPAIKEHIRDLQAFSDAFNNFVNLASNASLITTANRLANDLDSKGIHRYSPVTIGQGMYQDLLKRNFNTEDYTGATWSDGRFYHDFWWIDMQDHRLFNNPDVSIPLGDPIALAADIAVQAVEKYVDDLVALGAPTKEDSPLNSQIRKMEILSEYIEPAATTAEMAALLFALYKTENVNGARVFSHYRKFPNSEVESPFGASPVYLGNGIIFQGFRDKKNVKENYLKYLENVRNPKPNEEPIQYSLRLRHFFDRASAAANEQFDNELSSSAETLVNSTRIGLYENPEEFIRIVLSMYSSMTPEEAEDLIEGQLDEIEQSAKALGLSQHIFRTLLNTPVRRGYEFHDMFREARTYVEAYLGPLNDLEAAIQLVMTTPEIVDSLRDLFLNVENYLPAPNFAVSGDDANMEIIPTEEFYNIVESIIRVGVGLPPTTQSALDAGLSNPGDGQERDRVRTGLTDVDFNNAVPIMARLNMLLTPGVQAYVAAEDESKTRIIFDIGQMQRRKIWLSTTGILDWKYDSTGLYIGWPKGTPAPSDKYKRDRARQETTNFYKELEEEEPGSQKINQLVVNRIQFLSKQVQDAISRLSNNNVEHHLPALRDAFKWQDEITLAGRESGFVGANFTRDKFMLKFKAGSYSPRITMKEHQRNGNFDRYDITIKEDFFTSQNQGESVVYKYCEEIPQEQLEGRLVFDRTGSNNNFTKRRAWAAFLFDKIAEQFQSDKRAASLFGEDKESVSDSFGRVLFEQATVKTLEQVIFSLHQSRFFKVDYSNDLDDRISGNPIYTSNCVSNRFGFSDASILSFDKTILGDPAVEIALEASRPENSPYDRDFDTPGPFEKALKTIAVKAFIRAILVETLLKGGIAYASWDIEPVITERFFVDYVMQKVEADLENNRNLKDLWRPVLEKSESISNPKEALRKFITSELQKMPQYSKQIFNPNQPKRDFYEWGIGDVLPMVDCPWEKRKNEDDSYTRSYGFGGGRRSLEYCFRGQRSFHIEEYLYISLNDEVKQELEEIKRTQDVDLVFWHGSTTIGGFVSWFKGWVTRMEDYADSTLQNTANNLIQRVFQGLTVSHRARLVFLEVPRSYNGATVYGKYPSGNHVNPVHSVVKEHFGTRSELYRKSLNSRKGYVDVLLGSDGRGTRQRAFTVDLARVSNDISPRSCEGLWSFRVFDTRPKVISSLESTDSRNYMKQLLSQHPDFKFVMETVFPIRRFMTIGSVYTTSLLSGYSTVPDIMKASKEVISAIALISNTPRRFQEDLFAMNQSNFQDFLRKNFPSDPSDPSCFELPGLGKEFFEKFFSDLWKLFKSLPSILLRGIAFQMDPGYKEMRTHYLNCDIKHLRINHIAGQTADEKLINGLRLRGNPQQNKGEYASIMFSLPIDILYSLSNPFLTHHRLYKTILKTISYVYSGGAPFVDLNSVFKIPCLDIDENYLEGKKYDLGQYGRYGHPFSPFGLFALMTPELEMDKKMKRGKCKPGDPSIPCEDI